MKIAIIGAGLSGCVSYYQLARLGHDVKIFEKSRGVGGRISTKYVDNYKIDHGTPYFESSNSKFLEFCDLLCSNNILRKTNNIFYPVSGINKMCSFLIKEEDLITNTKIVSINNTSKSNIILYDDKNNKFEGFDLVIVTIPAPQILALDLPISGHFKNLLNTVSYHQIATIFAYKRLSYTKCQFTNTKSIFKKIVDNSEKYSYTKEEFESYVFHFTYELSDLIKSKNEIIPALYKYISHSTKICNLSHFNLHSHFWKYAIVRNNLNIGSYYDDINKIGYCGDYMLGSNLENAYLSAIDLTANKGMPI